MLAERGVLALPFEWNGWTGVDLLGPGDVVLEPEAADLPAGVVACGAEAVEACRIASGIPAMGAELTNKTIAAEAGFVERTVSFTKGCYTGQELVARIDSRGSNVARRLVGVIAADGPPEENPLSRGMTLHAGAAPAGDGAADDKVVGYHHLGHVEPRARCVGGPRLSASHVDAPGPVRVRSGEGIGGSRPAHVSDAPSGRPASASAGPELRRARRGA